MSHGLQEPHWSCSSYHTRFKGRGPVPFPGHLPFIQRLGNPPTPLCLRPGPYNIKIMFLLFYIRHFCFKNPLVLIHGAKASVKIPKILNIVKEGQEECIS